MADVSIDSSIVAVTARGVRAVVFTTDQIGYWFYLDSDGVFGYSKTTDGGATWGAQVNVDSTAETTIVAFDVWFDKWTPGDTGTKIHTWFFGVTADDVFYRSLDTNGDTLGTQVVASAEATAVAGRGAFVSGTKTRSGYLYVAYDIDAGAERELFRSTDGGATWGSSLSGTFVEATLDTCALFPASGTGDNNDMWAVYYDASATALTLKLWDSSAATAVESSTIQTHTDGSTDLTGQFGFSASVRHSDGHLILAAVSLRDNASSVHNVYDITDTSTITTKGNITTNIDDHYYPQVFIDQATNDIYVAYNGKRDGTEVLDTTTKVYYTKSTDGGTTWSAGDTAYMEGAAGVVQQVWAPLMGQRFYVGWRVGTTLLGNKVNSVVLSIYATPSETVRVSETAVPRINLSPVSLTETLHITDIGGGTIQVLGRIRSIDTLIDRSLTGESGLSQSLTEDLHISDTVLNARLAPLAVSLTETLLLTDVVTPLMGGLTTVLSETLHISDTATAYLTPLQAVLSETLHITDTVVNRFLSGDLAAVLSETLHITGVGEIQVLGRIRVIDTDLTVVRTGAGALTASVSETLHVADAVDSFIGIDDSETLHITESLTVVMGGLASVLAETLHITDTVATVLNPLLVVQSETLHIADVVTPRITLGDVTVAETLHLTDVITASMGDLAANLSETLHLTDVVTAIETPLLVSVSETLHLADVVTASMGDLATTLAETLHLSDSVTAELRPLVVGVLAETLLVSDAVTPQITLGDVALTETLHIADTVSAFESPLLAVLAETLHVSDAITGAALAAEGTLTTSVVETLRIADTVMVQFTVLQAVASETLHITDTVGTGLQLSAVLTETLHIAEVLTVASDLTVSLTEALRLTDSVTVRMVLGDVVLAETLHLSESIAGMQLAAFGDMFVAVSETLHVNDGHLFTSDARAIDLVGTYVVSLDVVGEYHPIVDLVGEYG